MNAVEIEEAVSKLAAEPFSPAEFPFAFLEAFGNKATTIQRLRSGASNASDVDGGVLQRNNIHIATCAAGEVTRILAALKASPKTASAKAKFILATDGSALEAEDLTSGETVACDYTDFANHFGFFLPLAGITTVAQIRNNTFDIRATSRLNRLYLELLKDNPEWEKADRRHDLNQFMARLIFCFFAENTGIFHGEQLFTRCVEQMSEGKPTDKFGNTHEVIGELFRAMDVRVEARKAANLRTWAENFPYVNGGLFSGNKEVPRFSRIARSYLLHAGSLPWQQINPDIFGSMIQAVADDEERGNLGMHYTSVPNILKVLNPLFLDSLREQLDQAGENSRKLLNLRRRIAAIRVFDPACGSGNFLVIAYIQMREIEAEIIRRRREENKKTWIKLSSFFGIEIKDFAAEIARLALLIAEFQCDVRYIGQRDALLDVLPLKPTGQIVTDNALRVDWLKVCPPAKPVVPPRKDLFDDVPEQLEVDFDAVEPETYICGNPPYKGSTWQTDAQKDDLRSVFDGRAKSWKSLDYVAGWFMKAVDYGQHTNTVAAFVSTNSICQGQQVPILWPLIFASGHEVAFAHTSFKWANLASYNAGVTVVIVGLSKQAGKVRRLFDDADDGKTTARDAANINAYLVPGANVLVSPSDEILSKISKMDNGNKAVDGGHLLLDTDELNELHLTDDQRRSFVRKFMGSSEAINGISRFCLWILDSQREIASAIPSIKSRVMAVQSERLISTKKLTRDSATKPHSFQQIRQHGTEILTIVPRVSSENRQYLPTLQVPAGTIISDKCFALYDAPLWNMALIASRLHWVWIGTVCVRLEMRFSYSNTLGWNTFPVPLLTEKNKADLTACAENILLAREAHFPATIADLYDPETMPENLRRAHEQNDLVLERIYIGRRFRNDTERLEKLFDLYTKMIAEKGSASGKPAKPKKAG